MSEQDGWFKRLQRKSFHKECGMSEIAVETEKFSNRHFIPTTCPECKRRIYLEKKNFTEERTRNRVYQHHYKYAMFSTRQLIVDDVTGKEHVAL